MRIQRASLLCWCVAAVVLVACSASAQSTNATANGLVVDGSNAVIVGASVMAINDGTNIAYSATTNSGGVYSLPNLPPGRYRIQVSAPGFKTLIKPDIILNVLDARAVNFTLQIGAASETVTVPGGVPLVNTESAAVGTVVDRQFVENMPLNGRSFQSLIALTPGVVTTKTSFGNEGQFSVNGQRTDANYFSVDGVSANFGASQFGALEQSGGGALPAVSAGGGFNNLVSIDALQEFKVQTSVYAPEFGRTPGGQVQIVTRSGTNGFHGTLFDYFRNDVFDANDWFNDSLGLRKSALRQNDFGGALGGPIIIPHLYDGHDRTFFFFSYEGLRLRLPQTGLVDVPSMTFRQTAAPQLQPFLNAFPIPNGPDRIIGGVATGAAGFAASHSDPSTLDAVSIRVDHVVGQKLALFARYNHAPSDNIQRGAQGASLNTINRASFTTQTLTGGATWTISPTLDNEFRANWSRSKGNLLRDIDDFGGAVVIPDSAFFPPFALRDSASGVFGTFNNLGTSIFASYAIGTPLANVQRQFDIVNNFSANIGTHRLKVGIDYRRLSPSSNPFSYSEQGFVSINTAPTGKAISVVIQGRQPVDLVFNNWSAYFQDSWKVVPRLSLTYGVRWDVNPPPSGQDDKALYTAQGLGNPATLTLAPRGTPLWRTTYGNFAPRVGVAYRLTDNQARATVLRAGFGIFYDLGTGTSATAANGFPYATAKILANVPYPPDIPTATPPAFNLTPSGASITAYPNLKLPRVYQWSVAMEQSLTASQAISATYIGAAGRRLLHQVMLSNPNPQFASVRITDNSATSDYDALQLQYNRRLSRGLQVLASYTWSHSIDDASTDYIDLDRARGPSDFDVRHSFSTAVSYNIPSPSAGGFAKAVLGDWSIDTVTSARSATPVNLIARTVTLADGSRQNIRPDLIASVPLYIYDPSFPGGREFNRAAFAIPPATPIRQGTLGRNALRSFSVLQVDFALRRQFPISDRLNLQFRADFFNILNHPNFGDPVNSLASGLFGQSTAMLGRSLGSGGVSGGFSPLYQIGGPRSIQLALRLRF